MIAAWLLACGAHPEVEVSGVRLQEAPIASGLRLVYRSTAEDPTALGVLRRRVARLPGQGTAAVYARGDELVVELPPGVGGPADGASLGRLAKVWLCPEGTAEEGDRVELCPPELGVARAEARTDRPGGPALYLELDPTGTARLAELSTASLASPPPRSSATDAALQLAGCRSAGSLGRRMLLVVDGVVVLAPVVRDPLTTGKLLIEPGPWAGDLQALAAALEGGALRAPLELVSVDTIR